MQSLPEGPRGERVSDAPTRAESGLPPWLTPNWNRLTQARAADRLPHALLIAGPRGVGKRLLVERLVRALLCPTPLPDGVACGHCADCRLVQAGSHPDLARVAPDPESKSGEITIDSIRDLRDRATLTAGRGGRILFVVDPADRMNTAAANALLKTLEEPPGPVLLCLIAEDPGRLPATVRSRCLLLRQGLPPPEQALEWLRNQMPQGQSVGPAPEMRLGLARGAPLSARDALDGGVLELHANRLESLVGLAQGRLDPVAEARAWSGAEARLSLSWLAGWLCDLLRLAVAGEDARLADAVGGRVLAELVPGIDLAAAHRLLRRVFRASGLKDSTVNPQLLLESLLVEWSRLFRR
jgi:DNA polymerase-3 subunit delta'